MNYLTYLKIPYRHQGHSYAGADCFGLLYLFYRDELGITLPLPDFDYEEKWWQHENYFTDLYRAYGFAPAEGPLAKGDVLLFRNTSTTAGHAGVVLDESSFMHMARSGCNIANHAYGTWRRQLHSAYRYTGRGAA